MTHTTHTQGPWTVSQPSGNYIDTPTGSVAALTYGATKADARLIAAAPDLLAALEVALPWLTKADIDGAFEGCALPLGGRKAWQQVERAIAKARGEIA